MTPNNSDKFLNLEVRLLPGFRKLTITLSTLLDQEHPLGNDFRIVLDYLGFSINAVGFLASRFRRPTEEALKSWPGTTGELVAALRRSQREDAVNCIRQWLGDIAVKQSQASTLHGNVCSSPTTVNSTLPTIEELLERTYEPVESTPLISPCHVSREETLPVQRSGEYLCDKFTHFVKGCWLIPKDTTWMTNTTVYVNNFARAGFIVILFVCLAECIFSAKHCPSYWLEFVIFLLPVMESFYVDKNMDPYKSLIHKIVECQNEIDELETILECRDTVATETVVGVPRDSRQEVSSKGRSTCEAGASIDRMSRPSISSESQTIYQKLQDANYRHAILLDEVQPIYRDMRLCVFTTLCLEGCILASLVLHASFCDTLENLHSRLRNGFTAISYCLLLVDCFYNFVVIATYYHDNTPETVIRKDRFRQRRISSSCLSRHMAASIRYGHDV